MRLSRGLCFAVLTILAACGGRVANGVGPGPDANAGGDQAAIDNALPAPPPEPAPPPAEENVTPPPAPRCGESRSHVVSYPCPGPCIPMGGRPGCMPTMRICTRTEADAPIPCPVPPPPVAPPAAADNATR